MSLLSKKTFFAIIVLFLFVGCNKNVNNDEYEIINILNKTYIKPIIRTKILRHNQIKLSQQDYDLAEGIFPDRFLLDSLWYSKFISNNKFCYILSDSLIAAIRNDRTTKEMNAFLGIDMKVQTSKTNKIDFSKIEENQNIIRVQDSTQIGEKIFLGNFIISQIYFDNKKNYAYAEITKIHYNKDNHHSIESLPITLRKINGKWSMK
ncbi:hypothetical protein [Kaistella yonginensis]|uniref:hypothetical protein n=1 Tax=Kaistella yonginensis TaxID=658267 RepID=UPI0025B3AC37|nr:hypothetical protein [Kaistella yonginensis]MDN3606390.1 hypothetical protein [Kaistella yonginensis]